MNEKYQIAEYNQTVAALSILREKYGRRFDVTTTKGMNAAREARAEVRGYRTSVEKLRAELKAPLLERGKLIDAEAKRITAELLSIEEPIDQAIKVEERRKEEEKAAKARAEAERVAGLRSKIEMIRQPLADVIGKDAATLRGAMEWVNAYQPDPAEFCEFLPEAIAARNEVRAILETMLIERKRADEEQARIQAEREELARLRQQDEERKAEQRRVEAEAKAKADAEAAAIRQAQEAEAARIAAAQRELDERQRKIDELGLFSNALLVPNQLCEHLCHLFVALMISHPDWSWRDHPDTAGTVPNGWFIAGMSLPTGDIAYPLPLSMWEMLDGAQIQITNISPNWGYETSVDNRKRLAEWCKNRSGGSDDNL